MSKNPRKAAYSGHDQHFIEMWLFFILVEWMASFGKMKNGEEIMIHEKGQTQHLLMITDRFLKFTWMMQPNYYK